ncbi:MAG TPA: aminotransferase class V-fold PLP-dependent enzyme [Ktedonosporobacter sp.]|nr:aminotransferase class V-fold PLP-dependent enzyme [Ktedonosporobacter sp.]
MTVLNAGTYRTRFPLLQSKIHLANCSQGPLSHDVIDALHSYEQSLLRDGMDWMRWMGVVGEAREEFARLIGASASDVAILGSVSDTISAIASCLPIYGRKRIVTTVDEFPTVGQAWLASAHHGRADVVFIESPDKFYGAELVEPYLGQETAVLSVHQVGYYNAALQNIRELAEVAHQHGSLLLVDAYQGLGTAPLDVGESGADIVVSGNLKYLLGIPGIAFMYVRPGLSSDLQPGITGWFGRVNPFNFDATRLDFAPGARRFEMGTPSVSAAYAARAGMHLIQEVGVPLIHQHIQQISQLALDGARQRGLEIASPLDVARKGAATAIRVGSYSHDIEAEMARRGIIVSARADVIRIAPHFFTTPEDIEKALNELSAVCEMVAGQRGRH